MEDGILVRLNDPYMLLETNGIEEKTNSCGRNKVESF